MEYQVRLFFTGTVRMRGRKNVRYVSTAGIYSNVLVIFLAYCISMSDNGGTSASAIRTAVQWRIQHRLE